MYIYFFIKSVLRWSENSVRFENSYGNWLPNGPNSVRFHLSVRYGMYGCILTCHSDRPLHMCSCKVRFEVRHSITSHKSLVMRRDKLCAKRSCKLRYTAFQKASFHLYMEPQHDKTNKMACAPSEDSDQPGHSPSLIRVFAVCSVGS